MKFRDHYDWVVLGDHPGALLSAGLVARLGLSVLVLPLSPGVQLTVSKTGQYLDPEPNFLIGLGKIERSSGLLSECLSRVGILPSELALIRSEGVLPQVVTPTKRILFASDDEVLKREVIREFGQDAMEKCGFLGALSHADLPTLNFWKALPERLTLLPGKANFTKTDTPPQSLEDLRKTLERTIGGKFSADEKRWFSQESLEAVAHCASSAGDEFKEFCEGLWHGITGTDPKYALAPDLVRMMALGRTGASYKGGMTAYRHLLVKLAKRLGAHVPEGAACKRIFIENGRFIGVQIANRGSVTAAAGGILGCSISHATDALSLDGRQWPHRLKSPPVLDGWRFTLALTVHAEAIPPGMQPHLVWQETGAPVLSLDVVDPKDYGSAESGHRWLFVRTQMPFTQESLTVDYQRMIAARMLRQVNELMPFLEYHILKIYPDFRSGSGEMSEIFGFKSLEVIPENLRCYGGNGLGSRSGIEGLFLATGESFPELGSFGPTVAALEATAWIAHRFGLAGPFA